MVAIDFGIIQNVHSQQIFMSSKKIHVIPENANY